jgi:hypothetical protein
MSFLLNLAELLLMGIVALDTLGFIVNNRKNPQSSDVKDFTRLCFTWVFFLVLRAVICGSCGGFFGAILYYVAFAAKVYISVPVLGGTEKLYNMLLEQNVVKHYIEVAVSIIKSKTGCCEKKEN